MAQRKTNAPRPAQGSKKAAPAKSTAARPGGRPPTRKPSKSIVNQKQTPWGLIITAVVIIAFAGAIVGYAVTRSSSSSSDAANARYTVAEIPDAKAIQGVTYKAEPNHDHIASGTVQYDTSPPIGGNHSPYWADCNGTVYPEAIANENAVHMLEHGAVWITYKPGLAKDQVDKLATYVKDKDRTAMSPYPGDMKDDISLQAWNYQLFVHDASDPRIQQFLDALRFNQKTTPEPTATCSQPTFIAHPSTWGHPLFTPAAS